MALADKFLHAVSNIEISSPVAGEGFIFDGHTKFLFTKGRGATLLPLGDEDVYLEDLYAIKTGKGYGSIAMKAFTEIADEHRVRIFVHACAPDKENQEKLYRFYNRFQFKDLGDRLMRRTPNYPRPSKFMRGSTHT